MNKREIYLIIASICIITFIPIVFFVNNFSSNQISDNISNWGAFGDYFGGILNSFFSLLSLFVTTYIAFKISKIEENRYRENLKFEKEKLLREFRESEYKRINFELQKVWISITHPDSEEAEKIIYNCVMQYRYFVTSNKHLFDFLKDKEIFSLKNSLDDIFKLISGNKELDKDTVIKVFVENLDNFNRKFQNYLLEN